MSIYADTSFFVSLYLNDAHTSEAERKIAVRPVLWMTPLHAAEWVHAVEQHVFRKLISRSEANRLIEKFNEHRGQGLWKEVAVPEMAFEVCGQLARRHAARLGVRTLDTLHVSCALELGADLFWTFDERQEKLALAVGLRKA
jgi:predicted nucleic acid-binding protein